jgi:hypothetical protein
MSSQDTIGAGDSFIAGFLYCYLVGGSIKDAVSNAVCFVYSHRLTMIKNFSIIGFLRMYPVNFITVTETRAEESKLKFAPGHNLTFSMFWIRIRPL